MFKFKKFPVPVIVVAASAVTASLPAFASGGASSGVDVSSVVSAIQGANAPIAAIGGAVLIVAVGVKVYKWVRRAM